MFAYAELRLFLHELLKHAEVFSFAMVEKAGRAGKPRTAIMRHDVDVDVDAAIEVARVEVECGVRSTFFFLTGCDTYNVATAVNRKHLIWLTDNDFEVGLHFDPFLYPDLPDDELLPAVRREAHWLSEISRQPIRSISLHSPSIHGRYPKFEGFVNAYDPAYFDPEFYLSDSCMDFRGKDPLEFVRNAEQRALQILLHPFHYSEAGSDYPECYAEFLRRFVTRIDETMQANATYRRQMLGRRLLGDLA